MARPRKSLIRRMFVQIDCAFWCIHDHFDVLAYLGLPTLAALVLGALAMVGIWRTWELPLLANYVLSAIVVPWVGLFIFTAMPLPCAVYAWKAARGEKATAGECFAFCTRRKGRLIGVFIRLGFLWFGSLVLFGLPLLWVWPRTCMAPLVALFEDERRIFRRSRRILNEDLAVSMIGSLYLGMGAVLGLMIMLPRLILGTETLGVHVMDARWRSIVLEYLWIFESASVAILLTAIAMNWWISMALVYRDIRRVREGEELKERITRLRAEIAA